MPRTASVIALLVACIATASYVATHRTSPADRTERYLASPELAYTPNGRNAWSHGQGVPPDTFGSKVRCTSSSCGGGYAVGEEVWMNDRPNIHEVARGADASDIWYDFHSPVTIPIKGSEALIFAVPPDWKLVIWGVWN